VTYNFDLTADDYNRPTLDGYSWKPVVRYFLPHALCACLATYLMVRHWLVASVPAAITIAALVFSITLAAFAMNWRKAFLTTVKRYYDDPDRKAILGPHTLSITEAGLESVGPLHKSFRDWRSVTQVAFTKTQVLFYTAFGIVYVLPLRAVADAEALESFLKRKSTCKLESA
jgi:hypothetical protein